MTLSPFGLFVGFHLHLLLRMNAGNNMQVGRKALQGRRGITGREKFNLAAGYMKGLRVGRARRDSQRQCSGVVQFITCTPLCSGQQKIMTW